ncbi:hypothetical protein FRB90_000192 [Tulasnella sp. 427]|nr:hypothetical protein FRB90_000192 [Tulasnella sp. 427]
MSSEGIMDRITAGMAAKNRSLIGVASVFLPNLLIPLEFQPAMTGALLILVFCVYTTVLPNYKTWAPLRIGLAIPAIYLFIDYGWSRAYPRPNRGVHLGMATTAFYGIMKVVEVCWVRDLDDERPRWIQKPQQALDKEQTTSKKVPAPGEVAPVVLPLPQDTWGRIAYSVDYITSVRGASWYGDRVWDFAPPYLYNYSPPSRAGHILFNLAFAIFQYLAADCLDMYIKSIPWDRTQGKPVTSLPVPLQITTVLAIAVHTILGLTFPATSYAILAVSLGSYPSSWAPILPNFPFAAPTMSEFWSKYWHHLFRRTFRRLADGGLWYLPGPLKTNRSFNRAIRYTIIFFLSSLLHVAILAGIPSDWAYPMPRSFLGIDAGTVKFFLTQPLGLILEDARGQHKSFRFVASHASPPSKRFKLHYIQTERDNRMRAIKGVLLTCDTAVKQILLTLNEKEAFIVEDLDETHVIIAPDKVERVRSALASELEKNAFSLEAAAP